MELDSERRLKAQEQGQTGPRPALHGGGEQGKLCLLGRSPPPTQATDPTGLATGRRTWNCDGSVDMDPSYLADSRLPHRPPPSPRSALGDAELRVPPSSAPGSTGPGLGLCEGLLALGQDL